MINFRVSLVSLILLFVRVMGYNETICQSYSTTNTNSAVQNYAVCTLPNACPGDIIAIDSCTDMTGQPWNLLFDDSQNSLPLKPWKSSNSVSCGWTYEIPLSVTTCQPYTIHEGCYYYTTCSSSVTMSLNGVPTQYPTPSPNRPTPVPSGSSKNPTFIPTRPTQSPTTARPSISPTDLPSSAPVEPTFQPSEPPTYQEFYYTGNVQEIVVPANMTSMSVDISGGRGGSGLYGTVPATVCAGGKGARVIATVSVVPGSTLYIYLGGQGADSGPEGGYNGGGSGTGTGTAGTGGGGASDIRTVKDDETTRIVVAGGGGGCYGVTGSDSAMADGGSSFMNGQDGYYYPVGSATAYYYMGAGGSQSSGGIGGCYCVGCYVASCGQSGSLAVGGTGASTASPNGGGGGGGGYYGGGGAYIGGAGGGGSSMVLGAVNYNANFTTPSPNGFMSVTFTDKIVCPPGTYLTSDGYSCVTCEKGAYTTTYNADHCSQCSYPTTNSGKGIDNDDCELVSLNVSFNDTAIILASLAFAVILAIMANGKNRMVILANFFWPALDVFSDFAYIMTNDFWGPILLYLSLVFVLFPVPFFFWMLIQMRAYPKWYGFITINHASVFWLRMGVDDKDHIYFAKFPCFGGSGRFPVISCPTHHSIIHVVLEIIVWVIALVSQGATIAVYLLFLNTYYPIMIFVHVLFYGFWLLMGIFFRLTNSIALGNVWNLWFLVWTGDNHFQTDIDCDTEQMNECLQHEFYLETLPQIGLQLTNNLLLGDFSLLAKISLAQSLINALDGCWKFIYYAWVSKTPMTLEEIPIGCKVELVIESLGIHWKFLDLSLKPQKKHFITTEKPVIVDDFGQTKLTEPLVNESSAPPDETTSKLHSLEKRGSDIEIA